MFRRMVKTIPLLIAMFICVASIHAKTLRWSSQGDMQSTDPHAAAEGLTSSINAHVYEA